MHNYKSILLVAGMGGVLVLIAGFLVSAEAGKRKKDGFLPTTSTSSEATGRTEKIQVAPKAEPTKELPAMLEKIRFTLESLKPGTAPLESPAMKVMEAACRVVQPGDWSLLEAEIARPGAPDGYRSMLILLAGASHADQALPFLVTEYERYPIKVVEALARNGGVAAFASMTALYSKATTYEQKFGMIQSLSRYPRKEASSFALGLISSEKDAEALLDIVTILRFFPSTESRSALVRLLRERGADESQKALLDRCVNSLAGMKSRDAALEILMIATDDGVGTTARASATGGLAFLIEPSIVVDVLDVLERRAASSPELTTFVMRNATKDHFARIDRIVESTSSRELAEALKAAREAIAASGH